MIKSILRTILPDSLLFRIQELRARRQVKQTASLNPRQVFSKIYAENKWGRSTEPGVRFFSGSGSHDEKVTGEYVASVRSMLANFPIKPDVVDLGCGDFAVGSKIRDLCGRYIACDVVPELIEFNKRRFGHLSVDFRVLDLVNDPLPGGDVVFVRQVLQHLSNNHISSFIPKLAPNFRQLVLTEHVPLVNGFPPNIDKPIGPGIRLAFNSGVDLAAAPFSLQHRESAVICEVPEGGGIIRTTLYQL
jgi:SAM-dependent methyltransferase